MSTDAATPGDALHVAIIMDGNGRWATDRGLPRLSGHRRGAAAVERIVEAAPRLGVGTLTLFAFSADNWRRPEVEVGGLMAIFDEYLREQGTRCVEHDIRFALIGRRDRLPLTLRRRAEALEASTSACRALFLRLAIDYSAREAIWLAAERLLRTGRVSRDELVASVRSGWGEPAEVPDVDLLIRTGGEQRLSDFLLWESAYAELWFTETPWPQFTSDHFSAAMMEFSRRQRRFGGLSPSPASARSHAADRDCQARASLDRSLPRR